MTIHNDLLFAVSSAGGGKIALVLGAGCSVEAPTCVPMARECSERIHERLVADTVLQPTDCPDPSDLSALSDAVFEKKNSQREVVVRLLDTYHLRNRRPNEGYLLAVALMLENVISSVVTLNFDLAISAAVTDLDAGSKIGVVERPEQMETQKQVNVYYLHRSSNEPDPEKWVLRTSTLENEWKKNWEEIVTTKVLTTPCVVFAGLGSPISVLLKSVELLRQAIPGGTRVFLVDPTDLASSRFAQLLTVGAEAHIQKKWCAFMQELSVRLLTEHIDRLKGAIEAKMHEDGLHEEDVGNVVERFRSQGLLGTGKTRASWFLTTENYLPASRFEPGLTADILMGVAMIERVLSAAASFDQQGIVTFSTANAPTRTMVLASGRGHRTRAALEAALSEIWRDAETPKEVVVFGTSDGAFVPAPPKDIVRGDDGDDQIIASRSLVLTHISEIRADPSKIAGLTV